MSWSEHQRRMLGAMGVRVWSPARSAAVVDAPPADAPRELALRPSPDAPRELPLQPSPDAPSKAPAELAPEAAPPAPVRPITLAKAASFLQATLADPLLAERAASIATLGWLELKDTVATCTACDLCKSRRRTVFGVGHVHAEWMIVGEAPGEQEDLSGEPFVGPAGQLLDQMLRAVGKSRRPPESLGEPAGGRVGGPTSSQPRGRVVAPVGDDEDGDPARRVFIANTLKCRPPRNRNPEPDEMARCEPFLQRQLALVKPRLILAMGRFAVRQLLRSDDAIGKLRGRVHHYEGIPVIVTYHPAYLLRNLRDKSKAWEDLCLAMSTTEGLAAAASEPAAPT